MPRSRVHHLKEPVRSPYDELTADSNTAFDDGYYVGALRDPERDGFPYSG